MVKPPDFLPPTADFESLNPLHPDAVRYRGTTRSGRSCVLVDNTGARLAPEEMRSILEALIAADAFGFQSRSAAGANTLDLARREGGHIQVAGELYRLIVFRYEARVEKF